MTMTPDPNVLSLVLVASKHFLRTREGFHAAPSVRGFIRHIEANMQLYEAFAAEGAGNTAARVEFGLWRLILIAVSETRFLFDKVRQIWRLF